MRKLWILAAVAALAVPVAAATVVYPNAVFVDREGTHPANFSIDTLCNGPALVTLEVYKLSGIQTHVVGVRSFTAPDPCLIDCSFPCPIPFSWTLTSPDATELKAKQRVALEGVGVTHPLSWELAGPFADGVLQTRQMPPWLPGPATG